jgi:hypothetical protein
MESDILRLLSRFNQNLALQCKVMSSYLQSGLFDLERLFFPPFSRTYSMLLAPLFGQSSVFITRCSEALGCRYSSLLFCLPHTPNPGKH